jgi:hypothetical protein
MLLSSRPAVSIVLLSLALGLTGCEKVREQPQWKVSSPPKPIAVADAIPLEYGDLVGITPGAAAGWAHLYFQRPDRSIVVVVVNGELGIIADKVVDFPRR